VLTVAEFSVEGRPMDGADPLLGPDHLADYGSRADAARRWRRLRGTALRAAKRIVSDPFTAEDIAQEASIRLMVNAQRTHIRDESGFVSTVARRLAIDHLREGSSRFETLVEDVHDETENEVPLRDDTGELLDELLTLEAALRQLLLQLRPRERTIVVLHDVFDYTFPEVAELVGRNEATCRQIATRARRRLTRTKCGADERAGIRARARQIASLMQDGDVDKVLSALAR
jgi:RNA polymerase sigma-70 factor, ECF subfamily